MAGNWAYDVFLSHTSPDKNAVEAIARRLADDAALSPFLDKWHLIPGNPWQEELEQALDTSRTCAVFIGPHGIGPWENIEMRSALDDRIKRTGFRVIPVLLPGAVLPERGTLPRFLSSLTWVDFRSGLQDAEAFRRLVAGIRGQPPGRPRIRVASPQHAVCPYQGLAVFDETDAPFFFGREADTQHLLEQLRTQRFLAVIGPSGSGKSSAVRAGVLAKLRQGALPDSDGWMYLVFKPGTRPLDELAVGLAGMKHQDNIASLRNSLAASERELYLQTRLLLQAHPAEARVCLIVDQFEEVFTLCQDQTERTQFIDVLRYAVTVAGGQSIILLTMRADFLTRAAEYKPLAELLSTHQFLIGPMDCDDLRRACEEPAHRVGVTLEDGLTASILDDAGREPGLLPLMEDALLQVWEQRRADQVMTLQAYRDLGGVRGALAKKADTLLTTLSPPQQTIVRRVFLRLTQPGEGTEDTRRRATRVELQTTAEETSMVADVIQILADARLLVTSEDQQVDVAHEALIRGWPRLRGWIEEDRAALRTHHRLTEAAEEWQRLQRDPGVLFRGALLTVVQEWRKTHEADLNRLERDFLEASVALQHQEEAQERQRLADEQPHLRALAEAQARREEQASAAKRSRRLARLAFCVALAAVAAGLLAGFQWQRVEQETQRARQETQRATQETQRGNTILAKYYWASAVNAQAAGDVQRPAHLFARSGALKSDPSEVKNALFAVHHHLKPFFLGSQMAHDATVNGMVFSKDERLMLSWARDGTVRLWQASDGAAVVVMKHEGGGWGRDLRSG
jgi:Novel STAND NTPase 1/TIR domain